MNLMKSVLCETLTLYSAFLSSFHTILETWYSSYLHKVSKNRMNEYQIAKNYLIH